MSVLRCGVARLLELKRNSIPLTVSVRCKTYKRSGAYLPEPPRTPYGIFGVICMVVPGLLIGATISKYIASFLEENDLFVPSEDDEDD